ncbi:MAG: hypothetical protein RLZZ488_663 [Pseudomonadota bacterium]
MKALLSVSAFSLISSYAFASTAAAPAAAAPAAATPAAATQAAAAATGSSYGSTDGKKDSGTKINMRIHLDPFYKNINDAAKNFKIPKVDSFRLFVERKFGEYSRADVEIRLSEFERRDNGKKKVWYVDSNDEGKSLVNTDTLKYFHFLFDVPAVEGLELGYVRELESGLFGYTDRIKSTTVVESPSFTGHMSRVEGFRGNYKIDDKNKVTYHVARNPDLNEYTLGTKPKETTWYHKLTGTSKIEDTTLEAGFGLQGQWLELSDKPSYELDTFYHVVAEHKVDDLKIKFGIANDVYAVAKLNSDGKLEADNNKALTVLTGVKYDLLPKEVTLIGEIGYRDLKLASKGLVNYSDTNLPKVDSAREASFVLAGQIFLDEKLSFIPSYNYYYSNRSHANTKNTTGEVFADRKKLEKGSDRKASKTEQALGLRIRYDY